ncbi:DUF4350 domain-containing protein [Demequina capsici]|uniref:DUF4350 domain-containing protein n=1 Tax=Demequina capsici TaxID=3075620 RepID=A0AA96F4F7_9MICO|nr:DUF4350 domain-containing protein [Demequina sp. OYTSA14]WNM23871.1 DUF4350 domain-containing protein [Demequina sp. OYTSA14]
MSRTVLAPEGYTLGDGSSAATVASARWGRSRWMVTVLGLVLVLVVGLALTRPQTSSTPLSISNPGADGAQAVAQILRHQGVTVEETGTLADAYRLLDGAGTLVIASYTFLSDDQVASIADHPGDIVWIAPDSNTLDAISPQLFAAVPTVQEQSMPASCDAPAAVAAKSLTGVAPRLQLSSGADGATGCFTDGSGYAYVMLTRDGARPVHVLADASIVDNAGLATDGAAALALHTMGHADHVVWYMGGELDDTVLGPDQTGSTYFTPRTPPWLVAGGVAALLTALVSAAWQGRRMGRLVTEPLPVIVRASEATRGRGRLYQRGRARGHALAALRAGATARIASRLALARSAPRGAVVAAIATHTGRDAAEIDTLLYGPPPTDDKTMLDLLARLDSLEDEVHRS